MSLGDAVSHQDLPSSLGGEQVLRDPAEGKFCFATP